MFIAGKYDGCRACGQLLLTVNRVVADGCPCNSGRGVNHGLVGPDVCTCVECDPAQTGSSRWRPAPAPRDYATPFGLRLVFALAFLAVFGALAWALYESAPGIR